MEEAQLYSLENLTVTAKEHPEENKEVCRSNCEGIGECNYSSLEIMYKEEVINTSKKLIRPDIIHF